jgi:hypothetical protein
MAEGKASRRGGRAFDEETTVHDFLPYCLLQADSECQRRRQQPARFERWAARDQRQAYK